MGNGPRDLQIAGSFAQMHADCKQCNCSGTAYGCSLHPKDQMYLCISLYFLHFQAAFAVTTQLVVALPAPKKKECLEIEDSIRFHQIPTTTETCERKNEWESETTKWENNMKNRCLVIGASISNQSFSDVSGSIRRHISDVENPPKFQEKLRASGVMATAAQRSLRYYSSVLVRDSLCHQSFNSIVI